MTDFDIVSDGSLSDAYSAYCARDYREALALFDARAKESGEAAYCSAFLRANGLGTKESPEDALKYLKKSVSLGFTPAVRDLSCLLLNFGKKKDAFDILFRMSSSDDPLILSDLASMYEEGIGCIHSEARADEATSRISGDSLPFREKGFAYLEKDNTILALPFLLRGAVLEDPLCAFAVSFLYSHGIGMVKDEGCADYWEEYSEDLGMDAYTREDFGPYLGWFARFDDVDRWFE